MSQAGRVRVGQCVAVRAVEVAVSVCLLNNSCRVTEVGGS
jgi:hypothetical protein